MAFPLSLLYQLQLKTNKKTNKMKQLIDLKSIWFNTKRALYATMVLSLAFSIPVLTWVELSHKENEPAKTIHVGNIITTAQSSTAIFARQS